MRDNRREGIIQFAKFGIVGLSNTVLTYIVYLGLYLSGVNYVAANIVGFVAGIINAFYWNHKYVFKQERKERQNLLKAFLKTMISYAGTGVVLNNALLIFWVEIAGISEIIAPVINVILTVPVNFMLNKYWAFKKEGER